MLNSNDNHLILGMNVRCLSIGGMKNRKIVERRPTCVGPKRIWYIDQSKQSLVYKLNTIHDVYFIFMLDGRTMIDHIQLIYIFVVNTN